MSIHSPRLRRGLFVAAILASGATSAYAQTNNPPTISGTPPATATVGVTYSFTPTARDPDGNRLTFTISNKPRWATFSSTTGRLTGAPIKRDIGVFNDIRIRVTDGQYTRALPLFSIRVYPATTPPPPPPGTGTLSERYPGDVGIAADPSVIFHDPFEDTSPSTLGNRYTEIANPSRVSMVADKPVKSRGARSVRLTAGGGLGEATHLFKNFATGQDEVYLRYYTKYTGADFAHSGMWFGGYNPNISYPWPRAGQKPVGNERFSFGLEAQPGGYMDMYSYWAKMRSWKSNPGAGDYWGNIFINKADFRRRSDWTCYEIHLKLNPDPTTGRDAVFEVWENDQLVRRYDNTGPFGYWLGDKFCPADADTPNCAPYAPSNPAQVLLDQQWRTSTALKFNHIWPQNYNTGSVSSALSFDDLVVARSRIGCLK